jgi:hypothetical protein
MLTEDQIAYGQQKNREHMYNQAKSERLEYKNLQKQIYGHVISWSEVDTTMVDVRYEQLCKNVNITPW